MKKLLLFLLVLPLVFYSCGSDDDNFDEEDKVLLIGTWTYTSGQGDAKTNNADATAEINTALTKRALYTYQSITFNADNTFEASSPRRASMQESGTYKVKDGLIIFNSTTDEGEMEEYQLSYVVTPSRMQTGEDMLQDVKEHPSNYYDVAKYPNLKVTQAIAVRNFKKIK